MTIDGAHARRWGARRGIPARFASLAPWAAGLILWAVGLPGFAQSPVHCGSGSVIAVRFATSPAQVQRLADAECLVLAGAKCR